MSLRDLSLAPSYRSDQGTLLSSFYVPCLNEATEYSRAVGYFSSTSLAVAMAGFRNFVRNRGRIRLVASPVLTFEDADAIRKGYRQRDDVIRDAVLRVLDETQLDEFARQRWALVSWLVAQNLLDIKLALVDHEGAVGIYHEKIGVFSDEPGNHVVFTGSANESIGGLVSNFESIDVYCSWIDTDAHRVASKRSEFERLWRNETPNLAVYDFPEAARLQLLRLRLAGAPDPTELDEPAPATSVLQPLNQGSWLRVDLYPWQEQAVAAWRLGGYRGILSMATGSGKTITSLAAAAALPDLRFLLVALPTLELVSQWLEQISERTSLLPPLVIADDAEHWADALSRWLRLLNRGTFFDRQRPPVAVATFRSLSGSRFRGVVDDAGGLPNGSMLIGDEVHGLGAPTALRGLRQEVAFRLGLSATPRRHFDGPGTDALIAYFGDVVYEFSLAEAVQAGILCPYDYDVFPAELAADEYQEYIDLTAQIGRLFGSEAADIEERRQHLLIRRAVILKRADAKSGLLDAIVARHPLRRGLVYCADIDQANGVARFLAGRGLRISRYTSNDTGRGRLLDEFASGRLDALVAVRCLDEGVDVPAADIAIILASDSSSRQFIQRRGRVLRAAHGKRKATIVDVLLTPPSALANHGCFRSELLRVAEFARDARNREVVVNRLARQLAPFGVIHADLM